MAIGKVPFAEQLAIRCKPYFDSLLGEGITKFDTYIEGLNADFLKDTSVLLEELRTRDGKTKEQLDAIQDTFRDYFATDIKDIKQMLEEQSKSQEDSADSADEKADDNSAQLNLIEDSVIQQKSTLEKPVASGKLTVLNMVAKLSNDFEEYVNEEKESKEADDEASEKAAKELETEDKETKKERKAAKSKVERSSKLLARIDKKVHENKVLRIMKWILFLVVGGWFFTKVFKPYLWQPLKAELKAAGLDLDQIGGKMDSWLKEKFPETYAKVKEYLDTISGMLESLVKKKTWWKGATERIESASWTDILFGLPALSLSAAEAGNQAVADREARKNKTVSNDTADGGGRGNAVEYTEFGPQVVSTMEDMPEYVQSQSTSHPQVGQVSEEENYNAIFESGYTDSETYSRAQFGAASPEHIQQLLAEGKIVKDEKASAAWSNWDDAQRMQVSTGENANVYRWADEASYGSHKGDDTSAETGRETYIITTHSAQVMYNIQNESSYVQ